MEKRKARKIDIYIKKKRNKKKQKEKIKKGIKE